MNARLCFFVAVLIQAPLSLLGQEAEKNEPTVVEEGKLTDVATQIGRLIHLRWSDNQLVIDRNHWIKSTGGEKAADEAEDAVQAMIDRGIPAEIAQRMADRRHGGRGGLQGRFGGAGFPTASSEGKLFTELKAAAGAMSGGSGGGGDEHHWDGHGQSIFMSMNTKDSTKDLRFMIREATSPSQELLVEEHHEKGLRIQFSSPARNLVFVNDLEGVVHVAHTTGERADAFRVGSYGEMVQQQPEFASEFAALLTDLGINAPLTDRDARIVATIGKLLVKPDAETQINALATIAKLNDQSFKIRNAAEKEVTKNVVAWRPFIDERLADKDLPVETRIRLQTIVAAADFDATEAEEYIKERKLLQDAEYLTSMLDVLPASLHESVRQHLDGLK